MEPMPCFLNAPLPVCQSGWAMLGVIQNVPQRIVERMEGIAKVHE